MLLIAGIATAVNETSHKPGSYGEQVALPFTGLRRPSGVVVDAGGNVYLSEIRGGRVLKLANRGTAPTELPLTGLRHPFGLAVDTNGNLYVTDNSDTGDGRVLRLDLGTGAQSELPFTGIGTAFGVAVDASGSVYVADSGNNQVLKLPVE
ncbi:MAG: hypothetical protein U0R77_11970 [Mycolicibacterium insubricum]|nr:hypothetical protein [Mycobacterium sp.]